MLIFERIKRVVTSRAHAAVDRAEDPREMLDQLVRERLLAVRNAKLALNRARAWRKQIESRINEAETAITRYSTVARTALADGNEDTARQALHGKNKAQANQEELQKQLLQSDRMVEKHKTTVDRLNHELSALRDKREVLKQRIQLSEGLRYVETDLLNAEPVDEVLARVEEHAVAAEVAVETITCHAEDEPEESMERYMRDRAVDDELEALRAELTQTQTQTQTEA